MPGTPLADVEALKGLVLSSQRWEKGHQIYLLSSEFIVYERIELYTFYYYNLQEIRQFM